jgi:mannose/fructose/N-acetylgalactosamine-specific phosphotransferase system component IIC
VPLTELPLGVVSWLALVGLGGVLALDAVSWPQAMVSRPLVSGTVGGWVLGDPEAGFLVGALLELLSLRFPPFGATRYPDAGPAGLIAGAAYAGAGGSDLAALVTALIAGWAVGWIGSASVHWRRQLNARLLAPADALAADPRRLERRHRLAALVDGSRGALLTAGFLLPAVVAAALAAGGATGVGATTLGAAALVTSLAVAAGAGGRTVSFGLRGWPLLLVGAVLGALLAGVLP